VTLAESLGAEPDPVMDAGYESGYVRMVVLGMDVNPDLPLPFITTAVYRFGSEGAALSYLTDLEAVTPAYAELSRFDIERVPGTSAARALSYSNPYESEGPDSLLIAVTIDELVLTIEVVGAGSLDQAEATALALIAQQVPCVAAGNACGTAVLPAGFSAAAG
jgi:hypothetical protein